ncbi:Solute carrier family 22 member 13 [Acropora cervicornis]|uniref:Solute carrier family 22 member 13 n=1 Tax=Acropora cervicornis TaxID=6130 RepID=A0AAD9VC36_ACRCE|nr:Solute carrier family 22 member 13 [Acropora cervicornis]
MKKALTTDEVLEKIGSFGRYQIVLNLFVNLTYGLWWAFTVLITMFIANEPGWKCVNKTTCPFNKTIYLEDDDYSHRCKIPREDWTFADDFTSIVTQFDLVCDRGSLPFVSTSVIFAGHFIGSIAVSTISDKFGRKIPLFVCGFFCCLFNFVSAFSPAFWVFAVFRSLVGFFIGAYSIPLFVLATEFSGIRHRSTAGTLVWVGYVLFYMILPTFAYAIRDWRVLTMVTGAPSFLIMAGWLFAASFISWGVSLSTPFLSGNIYINVLITAASALPAYPVMTYLNLSRRKVLMVTFIAAAVGAIGYRIGKIFMYLCIAKFGGESAFIMVYVYSVELFPTTLRNVGMGTSTAAARVSAFISVYSPLLIKVNRFLPFGIMAGLAVAGALVSMTLPETFNQPTMEDLVVKETSEGHELEKVENGNFDLVCDQGSFGFISTSVMFAGHFIGSIAVSPISDKFGRKIPLFIGAFSIPIFVLSTEFSGKRQRSTAGSLVWIGFIVFKMMIPGLAYGIRDWKILTMVSAAPGFLVLAAWFITPESVRWLLKKGRVSEAKRSLAKVAKMNGKEMPDEPLALPKQENLGDFCDLFSSPNMIHRTLGSWFAASFIAWGVGLSSPYLSGNIYINVLISAIAALPAYPVMTFLNLR